MYAELRFSDQTIGIKSPAEARGWASTKLPSLPPEFFNRDSSGKNLQGHCPYSISPRQGGVCITSFGPAATGRLLGLAVAIQSDFAASYPAGEFNFRTGNASLITKPYLQSYEVHDFVLQNSGGKVTRRMRHPRVGAPPAGVPRNSARPLPSSLRKRIWLEWKEKPDVPELTKLAEAVFRKKLEERCAVAGIELPEDAIFGNFEATPVRPVYAGEMPKFAVRLSFRSNVLFQGPWHLGSMAGKGNGRIRRPFKGAPKQTEEQLA